MSVVYPIVGCKYTALMTAGVIYEQKGLNTEDGPVRPETHVK